MDAALATLLQKLDVRVPPRSELKQAAVSIILKDRETPSVLLIKRAERVGDPWSGQVAFPGGKAQDGDATPKDTATREAREEVGLDLNWSADFLGYSAPFTTHTGTMNVVPTAFILKAPGEVHPNEEVASYRWVELTRLLSEKSKSTYRLEYDGQSVDLPSIVIDDFVVWGLTHRILTTLLTN